VWCCEDWACGGEPRAQNARAWGESVVLRVRETRGYRRNLIVETRRALSLSYYPAHGEILCINLLGT
jgi:hypothetical protein